MIDEATSGRDDAFASALAAEIDGLYRYAHWLVGNDAEAEDLVGDTMLRALERRDQFRGESSLRTWLHRILYHRAVDVSRHRSHELAVEDVERRWGDEHYSVDASVVLERAESRAGLAEALVHVPVHYRTVVVLHDAEGWTVTEIADQLGLSIAATKQRLRRGRMMLVSSLASAEERRMANRDVVLGCAQARALVSDYLDGELETQQQRNLETHLANCVTCPPLYASLVGVRELLGELHDPDSVIPKAMRRRLEARMQSSPTASD
ncbi:MAG: sigma-70 family RNA polymerase sigma factor [Acidimicrobiales bacterium]